LSPLERSRLETLIAERNRRQNRERAEQLGGDFAAFIRASWNIVDPAMPLIDNWHIDALAEHLQAIAEREIRFLMINIGPGYAKSVIASVMFSAWLWARDPMTKIIAATYAKSLTIRDSLRVRDLVSSDWYQDTFNPGWRVFQKETKVRQLDAKTGVWTWVKTNEDWLSNSVKGERRALSVGGAATGFRADGQIFDDLLNASEKYSEAKRDEAQEWAVKTMSSRFNDMRNGWRVVIGQRLHEKDPYGAMLDTGDYVHLNLPSEFERERKCCVWCRQHGPTTAIGWTDPRTEEGQLLFPELFTPEVIAKAKKDLGSYDYAGQHQQRPAPAEGGMFKRSYWRRYAREELPALNMVVISADCTFKDVSSSDYVAIHVWGVVGARFYLLARKHEQMGFTATKRAIRVLWEEFHPSATLIEDKANGSAVIEELSREVPGVIAITPDGGKVARASLLKGGLGMIGNLLGRGAAGAAVAESGAAAAGEGAAVAGGGLLSLISIPAIVVAAVGAALVWMTAHPDQVRKAASQAWDWTKGKAQEVGAAVHSVAEGAKAAGGWVKLLSREGGPLGDLARMTAKFEGFRSKVYNDVAGNATAFFGHKLRPGEDVSGQNPIGLLMSDLKSALATVHGLVKQHLSRNQENALADFVYNVGAQKFANSTLLRKLNAGDFAGAADQFQHWNHALVNGHMTTLKALTERRAAEAQLFRFADRPNTVEQKNDYHVTSTDPNGAASEIERRQVRMTADLVRNLAGAVQ